MLNVILSLTLSVVSSYHIGNSLTNDGLGNNSGNIQSGTFGIEAIAGVYGHVYTMSMHVDSSQGLTSIWESPDGAGGLIDAYRTPYGGYSDALPGYHWDHITLEPYLKPGETLGTDKVAISNFINLALENPENSDTIFYVYQVWPRLSFGNYSEYWNGSSPDEDSTLVRPRREYYDNLMGWARSTYTADGTVVREIPTGEVWNRINLMIESGEITEISMADLYRDDLHASGALGRYLASATIFSTIFKTDVTGLIPPVEQYGSDYSSALYDTFNRVIWDVVSSDPDSGIADFNSDGYVDDLDLAEWHVGYDAGTYTGRDFLNWQRAYKAQELGGFSTIPEASTLVLLLTGVLCLTSKRAYVPVMLLTLTALPAWAQIDSPSTCRIVGFNPTSASVHSYGTGVLVAKDSKFGWILTARHVIEDEDNSIRYVVLFPKSERIAYSVIVAEGFYTEDKDIDIALINIDPPEDIEPRPILWEVPKTGDKVWVSGFGNHDQKAKEYSCKVLPTEGETTTGYFSFTSPSLLLLDKPSRLGDSGGPVVNAEGRVIGVVSATTTTFGLHTTVGDQKWVRKILEFNAW